MPLPKPSPALGIKLAALAVHAAEYIAYGQELDAAVIQSILEDDEVVAYMEVTLRPAALLPLPRYAATALPIAQIIPTAPTPAR